MCTGSERILTPTASISTFSSSLHLFLFHLCVSLPSLQSPPPPTHTHTSVHLPSLSWSVRRSRRWRCGRHEEGLERSWEGPRRGPGRVLAVVLGGVIGGVFEGVLAGVLGGVFGGVLGEVLEGVLGGVLEGVLEGVPGPTVINLMI